MHSGQSTAKQFGKIDEIFDGKCVSSFTDTSSSRSIDEDSNEDKRTALDLLITKLVTLALEC